MVAPTRHDLSTALSRLEIENNISKKELVHAMQLSFSELSHEPFISLIAAYLPASNRPRVSSVEQGPLKAAKTSQLVNALKRYCELFFSGSRYSFVILRNQLLAENAQLLNRLTPRSLVMVAEAAAAVNRSWDNEGTPLFKALEKVCTPQSLGHFKLYELARIEMAFRESDILAESFMNTLKNARNRLFDPSSLCSHYGAFGQVTAIKMLFALAVHSLSITYNETTGKLTIPNSSKIDKETIQTIFSGTTYGRLHPEVLDETDVLGNRLVRLAERETWEIRLHTSPGSKS
jgi:hypothetical protein